MRSAAACRHEPEVVEAVLLGRWPVRVDDDLRVHVEGCSACGDAVELAAVFAAESAALEAEAGRRLADGRLVWWRAQMRARQAARRAALQPIVAAGVLAVVAGVGAAAGLAGALSGFFADWADRAGTVAGLAVTKLFAWPSSVTALAANHLAVVAVVTTALLVLPVVFYLALREE